MWKKGEQKSEKIREKIRGIAHTGVYISRSTVMVGAEKAEGNKNILG